MTQTERISQAIEQENADRERQAQASTRDFIAKIVAHQAEIKSIQLKIADLKTKLAAVSYEPVNAADIVG